MLEMRWAAEAQGAERRRAEGWDAGYGFGWSVGWLVGREVAWVGAQDLEQARTNGWEEGHAAGWQQAWQAGQQRGKDAGWMAGWQQGWRWQQDWTDRRDLEEQEVQVRWCPQHESEEKASSSWPQLHLTGFSPFPTGVKSKSTGFSSFLAGFWT